MTVRTQRPVTKIVAPKFTPPNMAVIISVSWMIWMRWMEAASSQERKCSQRGRGTLTHYRGPRTPLPEKGKEKRDICVNSLEGLLTLLKYLDLCQQISNNLKINYLFLVNRRVNTKDKLREANLFQSFVYPNISWPMEEGDPSGRPLLAESKKRVKSDVHLSFRELSLIHWFLLSSLSKHPFHTFFCAKIYLYHKAGWITC